MSCNVYRSLHDSANTGVSLLAFSAIFPAVRDPWK